MERTHLLRAEFGQRFEYARRIISYVTATGGVLLIVGMLLTIFWFSAICGASAGWGEERPIDIPLLVGLNLMQAGFALGISAFLWQCMYAKLCRLAKCEVFVLEEEANLNWIDATVIGCVFTCVILVIFLPSFLVASFVGLTAVAAGARVMLYDRKCEMLKRLKSAESEPMTAHK